MVNSYAIFMAIDEERVEILLDAVANYFGLTVGLTIPSMNCSATILGATCQDNPTANTLLINSSISLNTHSSNEASGIPP